MFRAIVLAGCSLVGCDDAAVVEPPEPPPVAEPLDPEPEPVLEAETEPEPVPETVVEAEPAPVVEAEPEPEPTMMTPRMRRPQKAEAPCPPGSELPNPPCFYIL